MDIIKTIIHITIISLDIHGAYFNQKAWGPDGRLHGLRGRAAQQGRPETQAQPVNNWDARIPGSEKKRKTCGFYMV